MPSSSGGICAGCRTRPVETRWRPFCSQRCRLLDLARWVDGGYRVPGEAVAAPTDADEPSVAEP